MGGLPLKSTTVNNWGLIGLLSLASCAAIPGLEDPSLTLIPAVTLLDIEGDTSMQSPSGLAPANNSTFSLRDLGVGERSSEVGGAVRMGDGFAGVDLLYLNIDNSSARSGTLPDDWGNLQSGDVVSTRVEGNEFRLRYIAQMYEHTLPTDDEDLVLHAGAGGVLAHRELKFQATAAGGSRTQVAAAKDNGVLYLAGRGRLTYGGLGLIADLAVSPYLNLGGDFEGAMWDLELMATYTLEDQDLTAYVGWRRAEMPASGSDGGFHYDLDLTMDGYFLGLEITF